MALIICPDCGSQHSDEALSCPKCGRPNPAYAGATRFPGSSTHGNPGAGAQTGIPNYLVHAILVTLCCCLPFGIVAIVYASQVNSKLGAGDIVGARAASEKAKMWCLIALGVGLASQIAYFAFLGGMTMVQEMVGAPQ